MFGQITLISCLLLSLFGAAIFHFQIQQTPSDLADYQAILAKHKELRSKKTLKTHAAIQTREGVQKEIWTPKETGRTYFRLNSEHSNLTIQDKSIIEKLENLKCLVQEDPIEFKTLTAAAGTYSFPSHEFKADSVDIEFIRNKPYLRGKATDVSFSAKDKTLHFTADHLQADLDHKQVLKEGL